MNYVIGSGPAGVSCALGLLSQGEQVTLIDAGVECEPEKLAIADRLRGVSPEHWDPELVSQIQGPRLESGGLPLKLAYGSRFPYAEDSQYEFLQSGTKCLQSFARGGLSNVWGAAVLPYTRADFKNWPLSLEDLKPHYKEIGQVLEIAGVRDALEEAFPFYSDPLPGAALSRQAVKTLESLEKQKRKLRSRGFSFGRSRLALRTQSTATGPACENVGLCLSGCPYRAIYNSNQTLEILKSRPDFSYQEGWLVETVGESGETVTLTCRSLHHPSEKREFRGSKAFLACGAILTSRLVLQSLGVFDREFLLKFHPYFFLPLIAFRNTRGVEKERLHTLSQLFVEISDPKLSPYPIHLQYYSYNEMIRQRLHAALPRSLRAFLEPWILGRLLFIQGYLNSEEARGIRLALKKRNSESSALELKCQDETSMKVVAKKVSWALLKHARAQGALPLVPLLEMGKPGDGNHVGGIFPMKKNPGEFETDPLGRLPHWRKIHLVDSSILTNLPATTITYTAMANAHRIGVSSAKS